MAQDIIEQLQTMCTRLREKLMQQPEYRALQSLERTIEDLAGCRDVLPFETPLSQGLDMSQGATHVADALADALGVETEQTSPIARAADHLPSHRVA